MLFWLEIDYADDLTVAFLREPDRAALAAALPAIALPGLLPPGQIDGALVTVDDGAAGNLNLNLDNGNGKLTEWLALAPLLAPARLMELVDSEMRTEFSGGVDSLSIGETASIGIIG